MTVVIMIDGKVHEFTDDKIIDEFAWHNSRTSNHCAMVREKIFTELYRLAKAKEG